MLESILKETYGISVYQEQVMQIVQVCGGFSLGRADIVRRAMSKKNNKLLNAQKPDFLAGCRSNGIDDVQGEELWARIEMFSGYGFNKSHSMAYAVIAYQTAYLKAHYPVEFMCALLISESGDLKKTALYVEECHRLGITVLAPDVNHSEAAFTVEDGAIRFGLSAIKNLGELPCNAIVAGREEDGPYRDIYDFCTRISGQSINARVIESLNKAGAFASTVWNRRQ